MSGIGKASAWFGAFLLFIMALAAWSRVSTMKEGPLIIDKLSKGLANLFKGVLE